MKLEYQFRLALKITIQLIVISIVYYWHDYNRAADHPRMV